MAQQLPMFGPDSTPETATTGSPTDWAHSLVNAVVAPDWQPLLQRFWGGAAGQQLLAFLRQRAQAGATIYPPQPLRALALTPLSQVRVVVLGQDPYHGPGQAEGLAFSVPAGQRLPPSLRNIFKELLRHANLPATAMPTSGSLQHWAEQGVLLLNTTLTVEDGQPASHAKQGWEVLTDQLIAACSALPHPVAFLLWGAHAQAKAQLIDATRHLVLLANHPSPLSATRGPQPFIGCGHFGAVNHWLSQRSDKNIHWLA
jgi:uracil-DNA glycosylase